MIGVASFLYMILHLFLYIADEAYDMSVVVSEIVLRIYLTIGFTAWLGMIIILVYAIAALFAPWIAPFGESEIVGKQYLPPSAEFGSAPTRSAATC